MGSRLVGPLWLCVCASADLILHRSTSAVAQLARRLLDPAVMLPHGRVHTALDAEPELTPAEELELVGADVGRMGWEYR